MPLEPGIYVVVEEIPALGLKPGDSVQLTEDDAGQPMVVTAHVRDADFLQALEPHVDRLVPQPSRAERRRMLRELDKLAAGKAETMIVRGRRREVGGPSGGKHWTY